MTTTNIFEDKNKDYLFGTVLFQQT